MKKKKSLTTRCAMARTLNVIGEWWSLLIIREALAGVTRFSDFQRNLGAAKNIVSLRLKTLVEQGILEMVPAANGSAYQEYRPTDKCRALMPVLVALAQWGRDHLFEAGESCVVPLDARDKLPLDRIELRSSRGDPLKVEEVLIR
ncbi:MAG: putative transcriptional regulator [Akkermansiaceae bacterium]|nr:putative transcriptional regulator [Akkermansiaceae bacterium]